MLEGSLGLNERELCRLVLVGNQRSLNHDMLFGIRELVDIAERVVPQLERASAAGARFRSRAGYEHSWST